MVSGTVYGSAAARRHPTEPNRDDWQLQLGLAATGPVDLEHWQCTITYQPGVRLQGGGGCTVTASPTGIHTITPDNGTIRAGGRATVAVRVHGTTCAPLGIQFRAHTARGLPLLVRCDVLAVVHTDDTSHPATDTTWSRSSTVQRGINAIDPWRDWASPTATMSAAIATGSHLPSQRSRSRTQGRRRTLCPGARRGPSTPPACRRIGTPTT